MPGDERKLCRLFIHFGSLTLLFSKKLSLLFLPLPIPLGTGAGEKGSSQDLKWPWLTRERRRRRRAIRMSLPGVEERGKIAPGLTHVEKHAIILIRCENVFSSCPPPFSVDKQGPFSLFIPLFKRTEKGRA